MKKTTLPYQRVLIKLSGEALMGSHLAGVYSDACMEMCKSVKDLLDKKVQVGIVLGGGNIFRGIQGHQLGIDRTPADHMGMLATMINGIALQHVFEQIDVPSVVLSAIACPAMFELYHWRKAINYLQQGMVVIFVGGTGNPYFTTDSAAALRASEIKAEILLKATKVDGIYSQDPMKYPNALFHSHLTYRDVLAQKLDVMDATAIALCMANKIPILVFNIRAHHSLIEILTNRSIGTLVHWETS